MLSLFLEPHKILLSSGIRPRIVVFKQSILNKSEER